MLIKDLIASMMVKRKILVSKAASHRHWSFGGLTIPSLNYQNRNDFFAAWSLSIKATILLSIIFVRTVVAQLPDYPITKLPLPLQNCQGQNDMEQNIGHSKISITVVYDNVIYDSTLTTEWGFGCVIQTEKDTVLFDTASNGNVLLDNMAKLNIDPHSIQSVVISHNHYDHQGGLNDFLAVNSKVTVFIPNASPADLEQEIHSKGVKAVRVDSFTQINESMFSAGELKENIPEQSLVVQSPKGLVIITGCAHPDIVRIIEHVKLLFPYEPIYLVMGGFHLKSETTQNNEKIVKTIQDYGIQKIAPSHCTGEEAIGVFKQLFGESFIESGVGKKIVL